MDSPRGNLTRILEHMVIRRSTSLIAILFLVGVRPLMCQDTKPCNNEVLVKTERQLGHLDAASWAEFFSVIDPRCKGDQQYMEWVNDLLFKALEAQPQDFMETFDGLSKLTQRVILDELSTPRNPDVDAGRTYDYARDIPAPAESKQRILQALTKAGCRCDTPVVQ